MNKFFSSVWFRCIAFLLVLASLLGGLLAVLNTLLFVTPAERTERAIAKIYDGEKKEYSTLLDVDDQNRTDEELVYEGFGSISKIYSIEETDTLFKVVGENGYKNGTVTLWVKVVEVDGRINIDKVIIESNEKQSLISYLNGKYTDGFLIDITDSYKNGEFFYSHKKYKDEINYNPVSGASYSATAGSNAINCIITYYGEVNDEN